MKGIKVPLFVCVALFFNSCVIMSPAALKAVTI